MIEVINVEQVDPDRFAVTLNHDDAVRRYVFMIQRPRPGELPISAIETPDEIYIDLEQYEVPKGGVVDNPIIHKLCRLVRAVDRGEQPPLPLVLDHDWHPGQGSAEVKNKPLW